MVAQHVDVLRESVPGVVYPRADEYTSKSLQELGAKQGKRSRAPRSPRVSPVNKVVKKAKKVTIREAELVANSSLAVTRPQSGVLLDVASGSRDSVTVGQRKRKRFELASDVEYL